MTTVAHPLTFADLDRVNLCLALDGIPVTARLDGPPGVVLLHCALSPDTRQVARTLHTVCRATDAPVRWAGGDVR
jgi:hypothetical protein